ncbi:aspartate-semialdehyde dehydrogenase [Megasphaera cerevisiae DSM 20462]|jgi:aspartate-semialdehyde dehydrogenase|uniref:Aspartate-semialdehyde dehydrogenase n=1 Tax=Megasphaera cerevisiae DSM 20462 TaxID=1122219 RepID=A0A0J6WT10_9FIRM|nr:aspartate-semialdehyde dehydrogenase [Megasphaera cerevisiae]KMO86650.1 aspartate-semialdehyde dehydrogenase [Megasphaera cerevisiae DSM 20462]MCI1750454.1 aspartate-semialdehyde dehydrogenase [Megasphaera cerevisiae]OKY52718.1 aspartate-semialdehyde dehydrogenase [Megasphaera cerevisiae]SJZ88390.1 aspartate-semialdehyde dehydrogenase [Megasphaera cerevisiae DSM 20462]
MTKKPVVAILGATGAVGQEFIRLIEEREFPYSKLKLLASIRSAGKKMMVNGTEYTIEEARPESFDGVDIGLFAGGSISKTLGPEAAKRGCIVIDNSSAFRMDPAVPLVVPEVNPEDIAWHNGIIANPNCSTIIMLMALKPIHDVSPIKKIIVSTYQAVSGAGKEGIDELKEETEAYLKGEEMHPKILPSKSLHKHYPIAFNLIPHIDVFLENDYTKEEMKMVNETHKILHDTAIAISPTTVRVPVFRSHAESIQVETEAALTVEAVRRAIDQFPGAQVLDNPDKMEYPMPLYTSEKYDCYVGRIRKDIYNPKAINLWVSGDQIRKGAALNALQIAEYMLAHDMIK